MSHSSRNGNLETIFILYMKYATLPGFSHVPTHFQIQWNSFSMNPVSTYFLIIHTNKKSLFLSFIFCIATFINTKTICAILVSIHRFCSDLLFLCQQFSMIINITRRSRWCAGNHRRLMLKCQKLNFVAAILDFWRSSWIDNV